MKVDTKMKVYVVVGRTESGDEVGPYVFAFKPDTEELTKVIRADHECEFEGWETDELDEAIPILDGYWVPVQ